MRSYEREFDRTPRARCARVHRLAGPEVLAQPITASLPTSPPPLTKGGLGGSRPSMFRATQTPDPRHIRSVAVESRVMWKPASFGARV